MTVRVAGFHAAMSFRWLGPAAVGAFVSAAVTSLRRRVAEPGMPRMSTEWLLSHDQLAGRRLSQ